MTLGFRILILVSALAVPAFVAGCPGPEYPKCEKDDQCKKDKSGKDINEYCLFGQCQQCAKDNNCKSGEKCNRGRCEKACTGDDQCGTGQICEEAACVPAQCSDAKPCGGGMQCNKGRCAAPSTANNATPTSTGPLSCDKKQTVHFEFNMADLPGDSRTPLENFAKCMAQNNDWKLTIEGHCDERGTTDYNLALGERRAGTVKDYLMKLGVDKARIRTISYGKEKPIDPGSSEASWAKNRRAELVVQ